MRTELFCLALSAVLFAFCSSIEAQQAKKVYRVGVLHSGIPSSDKYVVEAFRKGLRELRYVEGENILLEHRWGEGKADRYRALAAELVGLKIDVLVTGGT